MKKQEVVLLGQCRYRLSTIKKYEPFLSPSNQYGIYVYFSVGAKSNREYITYENKEERDSVLEMLDNLFGVTY